MEISLKGLEMEIVNSTLPIMVEFWASWCAPCQMMIPVIEELINEYRGKVKVFKVNTDHAPQAVEKYKITGAPTFLFFKDGKEAERKVGAKSKDELKIFLNDLVR